MATPSLTEIAQAMRDMLPNLQVVGMPTGSIVFLMAKEPPSGFIAFKKTDKLMHSDYPKLVELMWQVGGSFKGDGSTYASIPDVSNRFLQMCSDISQVGKLIEAGLPNISGSFTHGGQSAANIRATGAFYDSGLYTGAQSNMTGDTWLPSYRKISFYASYSNSIFGRSSGIQPSSVGMLPCLKT